MQENEKKVQEKVEQPKVERQAEGNNNRHFHGNNKRPARAQHRPARQEKVDPFEERTVAVNRVSKTVKGGRNMRFASLVVAGNHKGSVGMGTGKAKEVPDGIKKASERARRNQVNVPITASGSIPHTIIGRHGACKVFLRPAPEGTGIVAGGPVRAVLELAGITNIYSKVYGSRTAINMVRATFNAIENLQTAEKVASLRGKSVEEIKSIKQ